MRLVNLLDELLRLLKKSPDFRVFHLDGQMAPLLDYVQIRPEKADEIRALIRQKRLRVGPWFVLADEFLVSSEALIRNLQVGRELMREWGGATEVAYSPDCFGHPAQIPQILDGFGLKYTFLWRGFSNPRPLLEAIWESPDGSRVLAGVLPRDLGYGDLFMGLGSLGDNDRAELGEEPGISPHQMLSLEGAKRVLAQRVQKKGNATESDVLILLAGVDHQRPHAQLVELLEWGNREIADCHFLISGCEEYFQELGARVKGGRLKPEVIQGKLRNTWRHDEGTGAYILPGVLSSRIHLKQRNHQAQTLLERYAEPLSAFWWLAGGEREAGFLRYAWSRLLENHAHDSIGGCSVDTVHRQMETRFDDAIEVASHLCDHRLADFLHEADLGEMSKEDSAAIIFNPLPWPVGGTVALELQWRTDLLKRYNLESLFSLRGVEFRSKDGTLHSAQITGAAERRIISKPHERQYYAPVYEWLCLPVRVHLPPLPASGYEVFTYRPTPQRSIWEVRTEGMASPALENEFLRVRWVDKEGIELVEKETGTAYRGLFQFEDSGDNGDLYGFSPPADNEVVVGGRTQAALVRNGPLEGVLRLVTDLETPVALEPGAQRRARARHALRIETDLLLARGARRVECVSRVRNSCRDHRLRVLFPTDLPTDEAWSEGAFHVDAWPVHVEQPRLKHGFFEEEPTTFPQHTFACVQGKRGGLALFNRGLPEFQLLPDARRTLALTLFRAVGFLGSKAVNTRQAPAGPPMPTPDAQLLREMEFAYALQPYRGSWREAEIWKAAAEYVAPPRHLTALETRGAGPSRRAFLEVTGKAVACSAIKSSENGRFLVVRLWNPTGDPAVADVACGCPLREAHLARLDEKPLKRLTPSPKGKVAVPLGPFQVVTLLLKVQRDPTKPLPAGQAYPVWTPVAAKPA